MAGGATWSSAVAGPVPIRTPSTPIASGVIPTKAGCGATVCANADAAVR